MLSLQNLLTAGRVLLLMTFFAGSQAMAQDAEGFSGRAGLGFLATSGNSESENANGNFDLWWNYEPWSHSLNGVAIRSSSSGVTTADATGIGWKSRYALNEADYLFGLLAWDKDEFSAYEQQVREAVGYGRHIVNTEKHLLSGEIGIGARQSDLRDGTSQSGTIYYLGGDYRWTISESSVFTQSIAVEQGSDNTYIESNTSLSAKVRSNLALVLSFTAKNNSDVLPDTEKTDTFTAISLEYTF